MRLLIYPKKDAVGLFVAQYVKEKIVAFVPTEEKPFYVLGLPTGGTPIPVYRALIEMFNAGELSFANVMTFNMDEYVGLPEDHPESYHSFMQTNLFAHIDIDMANVHILDGNASDLEAECKAYEAAIEACGGIDLFLGGIGPDGHVAFNEPGSSLSSKTRIKTLTYDTIVANARFFDGDLSKVSFIIFHFHHMTEFFSNLML
jgi:glucosamine-6-phosphate deaminase|tara:strand:+ start:925 stop:1530 length:606 start_codon:yes stop_codon:yes gene_type:complete